MKRKNSRKRVLLEEDAGSIIRARKRAKDASLERNEQVHEDSIMTEDNTDTQKKPNRLQRAVAKELPSSRKFKTIAQAKRLKKAEKNAGVLAALLDAPVEIFCEVAMHLSPLDLLNLSRVSHHLRSFLMSKSNRIVWKTSLLSADLPPCPEDLNEPQFASLVFDTDCNACGTPHIKSVRYDLRVRLCKECFAINVLPGYDIYREFFRDSELADDISFLRMKTLSFLLPADRSEDEIKFYVPDFVDLLQEIVNVSINNLDIDQFTERRVQWTCSIMEHALLMKAWEGQRADQRYLQLSSLADRHAESVISRLKELGYTEDDWTFFADSGHYEDQKQWVKLVKQKRELTARTWKNLLPKLEEHLAMRRIKITYAKRRLEFKEAYRNHMLCVPLTFGEFELMPTAHELIKMKDVEEFIGQDDGHRVITEELWSAFIPILERIIFKYGNDIVTNHEASIVNWRSTHKKEITDVDGNSRCLFFASSFFKDGRGDDTLYYFGSSRSVITHTSGKARSTDTRGPWLYGGTILNIAYDIPDALLGDLGFSSNTLMTYMQAMGSCFECCCCDVVFRKPMNWTDLVRHYQKEISYNREANSKYGVNCRRRLGIKYIEDHALDEGNLARIMDDSEMTSSGQEQNAATNAPERFVCNLCGRISVRGSPMTRAQVETHIRIKHQKDIPEAGDFRTIIPHFML